ncbi:caspase family protein [Actinoplanes sp. NPDC051470]|uniref:caspase, EACC1-associated type n=1 Tax=Actinoplanes sp. NPDC051470 TaxID=3157224 RepID=UPI0034176D26
MTYRALLIGNSAFESDAGLNPLNAPTKDVARLHRALVDPATGVFAEENVRLVIERSSHDLLDELDTFFSAAHRDDLLLLYYSGHGLLDERNQLFLCGRNTRSDKLLRTAVSNVRINEFIEQSVARCTVIILDCCSSGMFKGGDVSAPLAGPGRYVVSSTRGTALANDAAVPTGTSLFTEHLVTGLLGAAEDSDGDGYLDLREIFDYVRKKLTATTKQIPHCRFDGDAAVTLAKRPAAPVPAAPAVAAARAGDPSFVLSENVITLRDVGSDERLTPEVIEIYPLTDAPVNCTAETADAWLSAEVSGGRLTIGLRPRPGPNRGKVVVRDRDSGTAQVVRIHVTVERSSRPAPTTAEPTATVPDATVPRTPVPPTRVLARVPMPHAVADPPRPAESGGGRRRKKKWLVVAAAAVLLTAGALVPLWWDREPPSGPTTPIPSLVEVTASATSAATTGGTAATNEVKVPPVGTKHKTTDPPPRCEVPNVIGQTVDTARDVLSAAGRTARIEQVFSPAPEGTVVGQDPPGGTENGCGGSVSLSVSKGPDTTGSTDPVISQGQS